MIFTPPDALQHNCTLYTVLDLESSASRFHLLFLTSRLQHLFSIPPAVFTHQPLPSLVSCLPLWRHKQPPSPLSLPLLQPSFWLITSLWLCFYLFTFAHFLLLPQSALPLNFSNHEAAHTLPSCLHPLFFPSLTHSHPHFTTPHLGSFAVSFAVC